MSGPVEPFDPGGTGDPGFPVETGGPAPDGGSWPPADDDAVPYEREGDGTTPVRPGAPRAGGRRRHPWRIAALVVIVVGLVVLVGGYAWVQSEASPSGPPGPPVLVTVPAGAGVNSTGSLLADKGVITSSLAFRIWTQFHSLPGVQAGPYLFHQRSSFDAVEQVLAAGPNVFPVVVPPGFTVSELAQRVGQLPGHYADSFLAVATSGGVRSPWQLAGVTSLEGLLGTGTYTVMPGETDRQLLAKMVDR
ncbi:MAG TPA: endolytic transglycosylase MltG, partial [Acidimicrobiales bacterium]